MGMLDIEFNLQHGQQAKYVYLAMCQKPGKTLVTTITVFLYLNLKHVCSIYDLPSSVCFSQTIETLL